MNRRFARFFNFRSQWTEKRTRHARTDPNNREHGAFRFAELSPFCSRIASVFNRFSLSFADGFTQVCSSVVERLFYTASFVFHGPIPDNDKTLIWPLMKFTIAGNGDFAGSCVHIFSLDAAQPQNYAFD